MKTQIKITCPHCKTEQTIDTYPIINLQNDTDIYEDLFTLNLFKHECKKCKKNIIVQYDCLVIDMYKKYIIYLYTTDSLTNFNKNIDQLIEKLQADTQYKEVFNNLKYTRVVTTLNELLEKLLIFDYDLNDKVIEILKLGLYDKERLDKDIYKSICFNKIENDKLIFSCFNIYDNTVQPINISVDIKYYNIVIDSIGGTVPTDDKYFEYVNDIWSTLKVKNS